MTIKKIIFKLIIISLLLASFTSVVFAAGNVSVKVPNSKSTKQVKSKGKTQATQVTQAKRSSPSNSKKGKSVNGQNRRKPKTQNKSNTQNTKLGQNNVKKESVVDSTVDKSTADKSKDNTEEKVIDTNSVPDTTLNQDNILNSDSDTVSNQEGFIIESPEIEMIYEEVNEIPEQTNKATFKLGDFEKAMEEQNGKQKDITAAEAGKINEQSFEEKLKNYANNKKIEYGDRKPKKALINSDIPEVRPIPEMQQHSFDTSNYKPSSDLFSVVDQFDEDYCYKRLKYKVDSNFKEIETEPLIEFDGEFLTCNEALSRIEFLRFSELEENIQALNSLQEKRDAAVEYIKSLFK